jgi:RNA polymerase sigma-B factor
VANADVILFARYRRSRAEAARDELVQRYLPLARRLTMRYAAPASREDIFQVACMGLLEAIDRFDPARRCAFASFAIPTITGEIKHYLRDKAWIVRMPRAQHDLGLKAENATERLEGTLGREPSLSRLASELNSNTEDVGTALAAMSACRVASLDAGWDDAGDDGDTLGSHLGIVDAGYAGVEQRALLRELLSVLPVREREIVRLRFEEDLTQQQIAERVGVSQMHVSRLLRRCMKQLRAAAEESALPSAELAAG